MRVTVEDSSGQRVIVDPDEQREVLNKAVTVPEPEWDGAGIAARLLKADAELRYSLVVAYPANKCDVTVAADGFKDFASKEAVRAAAHSFMKSPRIGAWHKNGTEDAGECVESFLWPGEDWTVKSAGGDEYTIKEGDWLMGIIWTPEFWEKIRKGEVRGVSMQGRARRRQPSPQALAQLRT